MNCTCSIPQVEVYPIRLELGVHPLQEGKTVTRTFSRADKMSELLFSSYLFSSDSITKLIMLTINYCLSSCPRCCQGCHYQGV